MPRNPNWTRDELILALDLYFSLNVSQASPDDAEVIELSQLLNSLNIHPQGSGRGDFRNANGVYMKLCNFLRFDPDYEGIGLDRGSKLDEIIWDEFANDQLRLSATARAIRENTEILIGESSALDLDRAPVDEEFSEGRVLERIHKIKERDPRLVKRKKDSVLDRSGTLACEVCGFDFHTVYGELGKGFAECHHILPLAELRYSTNITINELAVVCANCHRMLHRGRPVHSLEALRQIITDSTTAS